MVLDSRWSYPTPQYELAPYYYENPCDWPGPRCGHTITAVSVGNCHLLILFGGMTNLGLSIATNAVHCFDLMTKKWTRVYPDGDGPTPRAGHAAASFDSMVAIQGGITSKAPDGDLYFLKMANNKFRWQRVVIRGEGPGPRYGHVMALAAQRLVIFGGIAGNKVLDDTWGLEINSCYAFDMTTALNSYWELDLDKSYKWERLTPFGILPSGRMYASAGTRDDGVFVLSGGRDSAGNSLGDTHLLEMHDDGWWTWKAAPGEEAPSPRHLHTVVLVNPRMHVIGGIVSMAGLNNDGISKVLNTLTGEWLDGNVRNINHLIGRSRHAAASVGSCIYIYGGVKGDVLVGDFLFAEDVTSQPSDSSSSNNAMNTLAEAPISFPTVDDAFHSFTVSSIEIFPGPKSVEDLCEKVISALLRPEDWKPPAEKEFFLNYFDIAELCNAAERIIVQEPTVLDLKAPVKVFGDLHGQFGDLMRLFREFGSPSRQGDIAYIDYLFLGDYVDRGMHSLETIVLLLALKIKYPESFHLIRGNHECHETNSVFGFLKESTERMGHTPGRQAWRRINSLFNHLPLAALIGNKIFCVHGGIGKSVDNVEQVRSIKRPIILPGDRTEVIKDLLWSDPTTNDSVMGAQKNQRGPDVCSFGPDLVKAFCERNKLELIIRAHECVLDGFERFAQGRLLTVFSATNYCGTANNAGAILVIGREFLIVPKLIHPLPPPIPSSENLTVETWQQELNIERPPTPVRESTEPGDSTAKAERFVNEQRRE